MSECFVCGKYDRSTKTLSTLLFVLPLEEELRQNYREGDVIYVNTKVYKLEERTIVKGEIVQYRMKAVRQ